MRRYLELLKVGGKLFILEKGGFKILNKNESISLDDYLNKIHGIKFSFSGGGLLIEKVADITKSDVPPLRLDAFYSDIPPFRDFSLITSKRGESAAQ